MFSIPLRVARSFRSDVPAAVVAATAVSTVVFVASPFLIHPLATQWNVSPGAVGLVSTLQLLGFVFSAWIGPRIFYPRRTVMTISIVLGVVSNLASAAAPNLTVLCLTRVGSGVALGLIAWVSWAEVFGDDERVGDVAVVGPLVGTIGAPVVATLIEVTSVRWLFVALAALFLIPAVFVHQMRLSVAQRTVRARHRPTRAAAAILFSLALFTFGGSSIFTFGADIGQRFDGLSAVATSFAFSFNSLASIPAARYRGERKVPGLWMAGTAGCALALGLVLHPVVLYLSIGLWGFLFWSGIPGAFSLLAERSAYPEERAGDAQAMMAVGRVAGPTIGGALYAIGPGPLAMVAAAVMLTASGLMLAVDRRS